MAWRDIELTINQNDEFSLVIEEISGERNLARPAYEQAEIAVKSIIEMARKAKSSILKVSGKCQTLTLAQEKYYGYGGNVIAFCAERGQGKTSVMLSFAESLRRHPCSASGGETKIPKDARFSVMSPIDPTLLERSSGSERPNFAGIVLSYLHRELVRFLRDGASDRADGEAQKRELFSKIKKCDNWFRASRTEKSDSSLDGLYETEYSLEVKQYINDIIASYLGYKMGQSCSPADSYLVIPVDDTDLNFSNAYSILEDIRRYFTLPNVIVLMAVERTQLLKILTAHFYDEMKIAGQMKLFTEKEAYRMAAKYLDKLIPASQTVSLPTVRSETENRNHIYIREQDNEDPKELQEYLFRTIFEKTGIIFTIHENYLHDLIPTTLRGIRHLIRLLREMKDCEQPRTLLPNHDAKPEDLPTLKKYALERKKWSEDLLWNLDRFEAYFLGDWCDSKLDMDASEAVKKVSAANFGILIPTAWKRAKNYIEKRGEGDSAYKPGKIVKKKLDTVRNTTPTYLDLRELLDAYRNDQLRESIFRFVFAMQTCLSMRLIRRALVNHIQKLENFLNPPDKENEPKLADVFVDSELAEVLKGGVLRLNGRDYVKEYTLPSGLLNESDKSALQSVFATQSPGENNGKLRLSSVVDYLFGLKKENGTGNDGSSSDGQKLFDCCMLVCCNIELQEQIEKWYDEVWKTAPGLTEKTNRVVILELDKWLLKRANYLPSAIFQEGVAAPLRYIAEMKKPKVAYFLENTVKQIEEAKREFEDIYVRRLRELHDDTQKMQEIKSDLDNYGLGGNAAAKSVLLSMVQHHEIITRILELLETACEKQDEASVEELKKALDEYVGKLKSEQPQ